MADKNKVISFASAFETSTKKDKSRKKKVLKKIEKSFADKIKVISFASAFETSTKKDKSRKKKF